MSSSSPLLRGAAVSSAVALLAGYVWQAQTSADQSAPAVTGQKTLLPGSKSFPVSSMVVPASSLTPTAATTVRDSSAISRNIAAEMLNPGANTKVKLPEVPSPVSKPPPEIRHMPGSKSAPIFSPSALSGPIFQTPKVADPRKEKDLPPLVPTRPDSPSLDVVERDQRTKAARDLATEMLQSPRALAVRKEANMISQDVPASEWMLEGQPSTRLYPLAPSVNHSRVLAGGVQLADGPAGQFMAKPPAVDVRSLTASAPQMKGVSASLMIPPGMTGAIATEQVRPVPRFSILLDPYPDQPLGPVVPRMEVARQHTLMAGSKSGFVFTPAFGDQIVEESIASLWRAIWSITPRPETPKKPAGRPSSAITPEGLPSQQEPLRIKP